MSNNIGILGGGEGGAPGVLQRNLYLLGRFRGGSSPESIQNINGTVPEIIYSTPTKITKNPGPRGRVMKVHCSMNSLYCLTENGNLYATGYRYLAGKGDSHAIDPSIWKITDGFELVDTNVSDIYDTNEYDGGCIYRKSNSYFISGANGWDVKTGNSTWNSIDGSVEDDWFPDPIRIKTLEGLDIVSMTGSMCLVAVTRDHKVYVKDDYQGDTGGMRYSDWVALGYFDGSFHVTLTEKTWSYNSITFEYFSAAFAGLTETPDNTLWISGNKLDEFPGFPIPDYETVSTRPTAVGGVFGSIANGISRIFNGYRQLNANNGVIAYISNGNLWGGAPGQIPVQLSTPDYLWDGLVQSYDQMGGMAAVGKRISTDQSVVARIQVHGWNSTDGLNRFEIVATLPVGQKIVHASGAIYSWSTAGGWGDSFINSANLALVVEEIAPAQIQPATTRYPTFKDTFKNGWPGLSLLDRDPEIGPVYTGKDTSGNYIRRQYLAMIPPDLHFNYKNVFNSQKNVFNSPQVKIVADGEVADIVGGWSFNLPAMIPQPPSYWSFKFKFSKLVKSYYDILNCDLPGYKYKTGDTLPESYGGLNPDFDLSVTKVGNEWKFLLYYYGTGTGQNYWGVVLPNWTVQENEVYEIRFDFGYSELQCFLSAASGASEMIIYDGILSAGYISDWTDHRLIPGGTSGMWSAAQGTDIINNDTFSLKSLPISLNWTKIASGLSAKTNYTNRLVAVANGSTEGYISNDGGTTWEPVFLVQAETQWVDLIFIDEFFTTNFVALARQASTIRYSSSGAGASTGGVAWSSASLPSVQDWSCLAYRPGNPTISDFGTLLAIAKNTTVCATSSGFATGWTARALPSSQVWSKVAWSRGVRQNDAANTFLGSGFLAIADGTSVNAFSADGITWAQGTTNLPSGNAWSGAGQTWVGLVALTNNTLSHCEFVGLSSTGTIIRSRPTSAYSGIMVQNTDSLTGFPLSGVTFKSLSVIDDILYATTVGGTIYWSRNIINWQTQVIQSTGNGATDASLQWINVAANRGNIVTLASNTTRVAASGQYDNVHLRFKAFEMGKLVTETWDSVGTINVANTSAPEWKPGNDGGLGHPYPAGLQHVAWNGLNNRIFFQYKDTPFYYASDTEGQTFISEAGNPNAAAFTTMGGLGTFAGSSMGDGFVPKFFGIAGANSVYAIGTLLSAPQVKINNYNGQPGTPWNTAGTTLATLKGNTFPIACAAGFINGQAAKRIILIYADGDVCHCDIAQGTSNLTVFDSFGSWTKVTGALPASARQVIHRPADVMSIGIFLTVTSNGTVHRSSDGITWFALGTISGSFIDVTQLVLGDDGSILAIGSGGTATRNKVYVTRNAGPTWEEGTLPYDISVGYFGSDDPYSANVVLDMPMEGSNNGTVFTDLKGHTVTSFNGAATKTDVRKINGISSAFFDGVNDYLTVAGSTDFNINNGTDWCVEFQLYNPNGGSTSPVIMQIGTSAHCIEVKATSTAGTYYITIREYINGSGFVGSPITSIQLDPTKWHHIAICRSSGNNVEIFADGISNGKAIYPTFDLGTAPIRIGAVDLSWTIMYGSFYMDDLRITKGSTRYTKDFSKNHVAAYSNGRYMIASSGSRDGAVSYDGIDWTKLALPQIGGTAVNMTNNWNQIIVTQGKEIIYTHDHNIAAYSTIR